MADKPEYQEPDFEILQYLDGHLDPAAQAAFRLRMEADPQLAREVQRYAALNEHLAGLADGGLERVDFRGQRSHIMASLEREALLSRKPRRLLIFRPAFAGLLAAAAALLLLSVGIGLHFFAADRGGNDGIAVSLDGAPAGGGAMAAIEVALAPIEPSPTGQSIIVVEVADLGQHAVPAPRSLPAISDMPTGSVLISISEPTQRPEPASDVMMFPFGPVDMGASYGI